MDDEILRGDLRRRVRQMNLEDDRPTNRRRQNQPRNDDVLAGDHVERLPLELSLGSTSHSSRQISPMTTSTSLPPAPPSPFTLPITTSSLPLAPASPFAPPMTTWQTPSSIAQYFASSQSHYMTYPPYLSNSIYQTRPPTPMQPSFGQSYNVFPSPSFPSPTRPAMRPVASAPVSRRGYRSQSSVNRKDDTIPPPFPWATNKRGWIQSLENLASKQITTITGEVQCKHCEQVYQVSYNLREKFAEVENIFVMGKWIMRERAPPIWNNPEPARCELCGRDKAVKPVIAERKSQINWLFLLLGQTLGFCTLEQLKNFCKHSKSHRTGAKNRVLYLTYLGLCKMLEPTRELFQRETARR
ncbi:F134 protein [Hirschfeldia incana]|nr:F134 protein [Hirschfeldia incana]